MVDLAAYAVWAPTLMLVIVRLTGIFLTAPVLSDPSIPPTVKGLLSVILALAVTAGMPAPAALPGDWVSLVLGLGGELLIGATIGFTAGLVLTGLAIAAEQIAQQMGIALASVFNPFFEDNTNVLGNTFQFTGLAIFLIIGGHRLMLGGLLDTFSGVPLMGFAASPALLEGVLDVLGAAFVLAIKVSAPATIALFLASAGMGFIQRTMPQLNILSAGFQVRVMLALAILAVSVATFAPLMQVAWEITFRRMLRLF